MTEYRIAPSLLAADFSNLKPQLEELKTAGADMLHFDVMDGAFVPQISFGQPVLSSVRKKTDLPIDVHLMILEPEKQIRSFQKAGADMITVHIEACKDPGDCIGLIRECGMKPSLSVKPGTPVETVFPYLKELSMVLIMTVEPGFGGQAFMPEMLRKIRLLREEIERQELDVDIEVDGGITAETLPLVKEAGANIFVSGSGIFRGNITDNILSCRKVLNS